MARRLFVTIMIVLLTGAAAGFALARSTGHSAPSAIYTLARGDSARVPAVGWTCVVAKTPQHGLGEALLCTTDRKPIRSLWITGDKIFVAAGHAPVRSGRGYLFHY